VEAAVCGAWSTVLRRLILFDIDGTLLTTNRAAARAFRAALEEVFGTSGPRRGVSFAGKTDPQIARELLTAAGLEKGAITDGLTALWRVYLRNLEGELATATLHVFPGVRLLLDRLEHAAEEAVPGLLTGNVREGARLKLGAAGIDFGRFRVGAYGSDHAERRELPAIAVQRAEKHFGRRFAGKEVVIIGDTPADIACGEHLGVRTLAVATGSYSEAELAACGPDHLFATLEDTDAVWRAMFD
jgi:phosphoglycolate phosphatase